MSEMLWGPGFALLSSVTWAIGSSRYSMMTRSYSAFAVNLARALFALPLFLGALFVVAGGWSAGISEILSLRWTQTAWLALSMIASYGLADVLFFRSTRIIGVPTALAIASLFPIWTALAANLLRDEKLTIVQMLGLILAVFGVVLVILKSPKVEADNPFLSKRLKQQGIGLAFVTSFLWAVNSYSVAQGGQGISAPLGAAVRMGFAVVFCLLFGLLSRPKAPLLIPAQAVVRNSWVFGLEAFGGSYFYMLGMTHSPLAVGATLTSLAPVISVPIAWAMGLEKLSPTRTLAICIVVLGISFLLSGGI